MHSECAAPIDIKRRVAHFPATKNGSPCDVPIIIISRGVSALNSQEPDAESNDSSNSEKTDSGRVFEIRSDAVTRAFERAVTRARKLYVERNASRSSSGQTASS